MTPEDALREYKSNESLNLHSLNFVLLAEFFGDEKAIGLAKKNHSLMTKRGYIDFLCPVYNEAYFACNHYYYKLSRKCLKNNNKFL